MSTPESRVPTLDCLIYNTYTLLCVDSIYCGYPHGQRIYNPYEIKPEPLREYLDMNFDNIKKG